MITHISWSQMQTWAQCPRRWRLERIHHLPEDVGPATQVGRDEHEHLAEGVVTDLNSPLHKMARVFIGSDDFEREKRLEAPIVGLTAVGYADVFAPGKVGDYKFTGSKAGIPASPKWEQGIWYYMLANGGPSDEPVEVAFFYRHIKNLTTKMFTTTVTPEEQRTSWALFEATAQEMKVDSTKAPNEVGFKPPGHGCWWYGKPCTYQHFCRRMVACPDYTGYEAPTPNTVMRKRR